MKRNSQITDLVHRLANISGRGRILALVTAIVVIFLNVPVFLFLKNNRETEASGDFKSHQSQMSVSPSLNNKKAGLEVVKSSTDVPLSIALKANIEAFDNKTGELSRNIISMLSISHSELQSIQSSFDLLLKQYTKAEAKQTRLIADRDGSCLELDDCADLVKHFFAEFNDAVSTAIGSDKAQFLTQMIKSQLRDGGSVPYRVYHKENKRTGKYTFVVEQLNESGVAISTKYWNPGMSGLDTSRWKYLLEAFREN